MLERVFVCTFFVFLYLLVFKHLESPALPFLSLLIFVAVVVVVVVVVVVGGGGGGGVVGGGGGDGVVGVVVGGGGGGRPGRAPATCAFRRRYGLTLL